MCVSAMVGTAAPVALYLRERGAEEAQARDAHGHPKLKGNVFLRRVPTVRIATPRADKSLSRFYSHPYTIVRCRTAGGLLQRTRTFAS